MKNIFIIIIAFYITAITIFAQKYNPVADSKAVVISGNARFTLLTPRLIRMEWSEDGKFEDRASLTIVNRKLPVPEYSKNENNGWLEIVTSELHLKYKTGGGKFNAENLSVEFTLGNEKKTWKYGDENKGNLLGTTTTLDETDGELSNWKDTTSRIKLEDGIISREGWSLVDDSKRPLFDNSDYPWVTARNAKEYQDFYFFGYGYNYKPAMKDFTETAGRIALPPKYVFGYWYSRWWPYTDSELREIVSTFEGLNIPLDILVVDMDWHLTSLKEFFKDDKRINDQAGQPVGWTGFTWDKNFFPYPADFLKWKAEKNLHICMNLHPASGIQPHEEKYSAMANALGIDPNTKKYVPFNITDKEWAKHFFDLVIHPIQKEGIDFWWLDWQQWSDTNIPGVNPIFYLNYVYYSDMERENKARPLIYHRWGGLGNHRYQIGFSGDTRISWRTLNYQPYFTTTASNVGFGYWGHDIGGFWGNADNNPELYTRWFQFGVFSPILKTHATHNPDIKKKIWEYPSEYFLIMKEAIELRYQLIPYIYTSAHAAYESGISICKPLYYEHPQNEESYSFKNEYYFGGDMIVNPVTKPIGKDSLFAYQTTWLPEGKWFEWSSGTMLEGGRAVKRTFTINEMPVYVKEGAIIPMQSKVKNLSEKPKKIILNIFPGSDGAASLYEDEGNNQNFKNGKYTVTKFEQKKIGNKVIITIYPAAGSFAGMDKQREYEIKLINSVPPELVKINGISIRETKDSQLKSWYYEGKELSVRIFTPKIDAAKKTIIEVSLSGNYQNLTDGKKAKFNRLNTFVKYLAGKRNFWRQTNWNDGINNSGIIVRSSQTGYIVTQNNKNFYSELSGFDKNWQEIIAMLKNVSGGNKIFKPYFDLLNVLK